LRLTIFARITKYQYSEIMEMKEIYPKLTKIENEIQVLKVLIIKSHKIPKKKSQVRRLVKRNQNR